MNRKKMGNELFSIGRLSLVLRPNLGNSLKLKGLMTLPIEVSFKKL